MALLIRLPAAMDAQLRRDAGMTHYDYSVLVHLSGSPEYTIKMKRLADLTEGSLSRLSQVISRMEDRGWVERSPDPHDGRTTLATLTEQGMSALEAAAPGHVHNVRQLVFDKLSREQVTELRDISQAVLVAAASEAYAPHESHILSGRTSGI
jgi:DNA-binding MarR family transcriptional regulator